MTEAGLVYSVPHMTHGVIYYSTPLIYVIIICKHWHTLFFTLLFVNNMFDSSCIKKWIYYNGHHYSCKSPFKIKPKYGYGQKERNRELSTRLHCTVGKILKLRKTKKRGARVHHPFFRKNDMYTPMASLQTKESLLLSQVRIVPIF